MAGQGTSIDNAKYARQKRLKDAIAAWIFLLPNFLGFLLITFFPIFFTFFVSFTKWDGIGFTSTRGDLKVQFRLREPMATDLTIPKGMVLSFTNEDVEQWDKVITLPYEVKQDITVASTTNLFEFLEISSLKQWSYYSNSNGVLIQPKLDELSADFKDYTQFAIEGNIYTMKNLDETLPYFKSQIAGLKGFVIDTKKSKEICLEVEKPGTTIVIPKGTVFYANIIVKAKNVTKNVYDFPVSNDIIIKAGEKVSGTNILSASRIGAVSKDPDAQLKKLYIAPADMAKLLNGATNNNITARVVGWLTTGSDGLSWIGIDNYKRIILTDDRFREYLFNTFFFLLQIPFGMALSLIMALAMNQPLKGIVVFRVLFFIPVISNIVAIALLWSVILETQNGFLNTFLRAIGIMNPPKWLGDKLWAKISIIIIEVWKGAGYNMMLYLAGLQNIPHDLYEAADIDGATAWQKFWKITWPMLSPMNFFILINGVIGGFQAFGTQFILTGGGPAGSTTTIVFYIWQKAYQAYQMGYATAIAVVLFILVMIFTAINWVSSEGKVEY